MLRYKSWILHFLGTVMFSPAMLLGPIMEEKQTLKVEMFSEFLEAPVCSGSFLYAFLSLFVLINSNKKFIFYFLGQSSNQCQCRNRKSLVAAVFCQTTNSS